MKDKTDNNQPKKKKKHKVVRRIRPIERLAIKAAAQNHSTNSVAKAFHVSFETVRRIMADDNIQPFNEEMFKRAADILATQSMAGAIKADEYVTEDKMEKASLVQLGVFKKISLETANLARERPTTITKHDDASELAISVIGELKKKLEYIDVSPTENEEKNHSENIENIAENQLNNQQSIDNSDVNSIQMSIPPDTVAKTSD